MRLVLIRHGQTPSNVLGLLDTAPPGPGLTDLGAAQAAAVPHTVGAEPIEAIYASTAVRAQQTAIPLARRRGLEITIRHDLREIAAGEWEMQDDDLSVRGYLGVIGGWMAGRLQDRTPGPNGESGTEVLERFDDVVREVVGTGVAGAALVAHGAVNRFWASTRATNLEDGFGAVNPLRNTGIVVLSGDLEQGWTAHSWTGAQVGAGLVGATPSAPGDEDPFDDAIPVPARP
ncbi:histidine phosphatase family protein [Nakamurella sp. PAMC28650]|uniref:histidine phosphatase family protein n=1 Tax=Nakamurella sp. PAMC28650 TaxID=2762325 RepID=UPI00164E7B82|nr:histidine phosphatase family protein [Nakamurella sp. PAMC28650]QNK81670.1 histidine phosphatase family protein [Nakamurella sp. PAMC28650]